MGANPERVTGPGNEEQVEQPPPSSLNRQPNKVVILGG
jgi:hypothetical protein